MLQSVFTAVDDSITTTGSRDPLGFEALWSALGYRVFENRITSIANDARNFTLVLLHHLIVRRLEISGKLDSLQERLLSLAPRVYEARANVVLATLVFLENLAAYSFASRPDEMELTGIIGTSNARAQLGSQDSLSITVSRSPENFVLVNQLGVGLNGRYKTPFITMGFFDYDYLYAPNAWEEVEALLKETPFNRLAELATQLLAKLIDSSGGKEYPEIALDDVPDVSALYRDCFRDRDVVARQPQLARFWKERLQFDRGAADLLYKAVGEAESDRKGAELWRSAVHIGLEMAEDAALPGEVVSSIRGIAHTEPSLSRLRYVFDMLCSPEIESAEKCVSALDAASQVPLSDFLRQQLAEADWENYYRDPEMSSGVRSRAARVAEVCKAGTTGDLVERLIEYHAWVMNARGGSPWVIQQGGRLIRNAGVYANPPEHVYQWYHSYYLDSLQYVRHGLEGEADGE